MPSYKGSISFLAQKNLLVSSCKEAIKLNNNKITGQQYLENIKRFNTKRKLAISAE